MKPLELIKYQGKSIAVLDLTHSTAEERMEYYKKTKPVIAKFPEKSLLIVTNVTDIRFTPESVAAIKDFVIGNSPYVKASAVVGADGLRDLIRVAVERSAGRSLRPFDTCQEAYDWLVGLP